MKKQPTKRAAPRKAKPADPAPDLVSKFTEMFTGILSGASVPVYSKQMDSGLYRACKHTFNGRTYEQIELDTLKGTAIASMLIESDIFSTVSTAGDTLTIDAGAIVSYLVQKKLIGRFLTVILLHEDGSAVPEAEFNGKLSEFVRFCIEVVVSFFALNQESLPTIGMLLMSGLGISSLGGQLIGMFSRGLKSSGLSASTDRKPAA